MNVGAFAVLGVLKKGGEEAETFDDLRGLAARRPFLAIIMAICVLSLAGIPPLIGFWGKLFLVGSAISAGYIWLAVLAVINSAIAAFYYLRIIAVCFLHEPDEQTQIAPLPARSMAAALSAIAVVVLSLGAGALLQGQTQCLPISPSIAGKKDTGPAANKNRGVSIECGADGNDNRIRLNFSPGTTIIVALE